MSKHHDARLEAWEKAEEEWEKAARRAREMAWEAREEEEAERLWGEEAAKAEAAAVAFARQEMWGDLL